MYFKQQSTVRFVLSIFVFSLVVIASLCNIQPAKADVPAPIQYVPAANAVLPNGCSNFSKTYSWNFSWSAVPNATQYRLQVYHIGAQWPLLNIYVNSNSYTYTSNGYFIESNRYNWEWSVQAVVGGVGGNWSPWRMFSVAPLTC